MYIFLGCVVVVICLYLSIKYSDLQSLEEVTKIAKKEIEERFYGLFSTTSMRYTYGNDVFDVRLKIVDIVVKEFYGVDYHVNVLYDIYVDDKLTSEQNKRYFGFYEYCGKEGYVYNRGIALETELKSHILSDISYAVSTYDSFSNLEIK